MLLLQTCPAEPVRKGLPPERCAMPRILIAFLAVLLSSCASQNSSVKLDNLLSIANSSSARNLARIASSSDPKASAKTLLEHKRDQWKQDPAQLARDLRTAQRDFNRLMGVLGGNVKKTWGGRETRLPGRKIYVKYNDQYRSRAIVDFERGEISVETLDENADASLKNAIVATLLTPG